MIDSHCHLDHEPLLSDLSNVLKRSKEVGIEISEDIENNLRQVSDLLKEING